jgi:putative addiction module component (TIGR02574 family)
MTKLEAVIERLKALPAAEQEEMAELVSQLLDEDEGEYSLTPAQEAELERRRAGPEDFATDEEVEAFFNRHVR